MTVPCSRINKHYQWKLWLAENWKKQKISLKAAFDILQKQSKI